MQERPFGVDAKAVAAKAVAAQPTREGALGRSGSVVIGQQPVLQEHSLFEAAWRVKLHAAAITAAAVAIILLIVSMVRSARS